MIANISVNHFDGLKSVAKSFDTARDNLVFVPFNSYAVALDMKSIKQQLGIEELDPIQIELLIEWLKANYQPEGSTNICDAMMRAYQKMSELAPQQEAGYVLISDGSATATRYLFSDAKGSLPTWSKYIGASRDYIHYSVTWSSSLGDFPGPGLLVQTDMIGMNHRWVAPDPPERPAIARPDPSAGIATCTAWPWTTPVVDSKYAYEQAITKVFSGCLNSLAFSIPGDGRTYGSEYRPGQRGFERFQEQFYNCPLAYADFLRRNQGTVHVLGYGQPATQKVPRTGDDPYQNARASSSRKDYFLARAANSYVRGVLEEQGAGNPPYPNFPGLPSYEDWQNGNAGNDTNSRREGELYTTPDLSQIDQLFSQIAQQITISLIE